MTCPTTRGSSSGSRSRPSSAPGTATARGPIARARAIPDDLGTAVTVQAMVFGNRGADSGDRRRCSPATRRPASRCCTATSCSTPRARTSSPGTHATEPIAVARRAPAGGRRASCARPRPGSSTTTRDLCDIEFTIEQGRLWMLQVRVGKRSPQAALRIAVDMAEDPSFPLSRRGGGRAGRPLLADPPTVTTGRSGYVLPLVTGLGASPGVASGEIATEPGGRGARPPRPAAPSILVRAETSPDDVHGMSRAAGILTARGGLASHAAVVARGWGIPAVVGAAGLEVGDGEVAIGGRTLRDGDDDHDRRRLGRGVRGRDPRPTEVVPQAADAARLGRGARRSPIGARPTSRSRSAAPADGARDRPVTLDGCVRAARDQGLRDDPRRSPMRSSRRRTPSSRCSTSWSSTASPRRSPGAYRLTEAGPERAARARRGRPRRVGRRARPTAALDAFLDARPPDEGDRHRLAARARATASRRSNDHCGRGLRSRRPRPAGRAPRGRRRLARARSSRRRRGSRGYRRAPRPRASSGPAAGDGKYVASPRVDSYHGVWFELHEDLILLAGRTRADEVEAGRA